MTLAEINRLELDFLYGTEFDVVVDGELFWRYEKALKMGRASGVESECGSSTAVSEACLSPSIPASCTSTPSSTLVSTTTFTAENARRTPPSRTFSEASIFQTPGSSLLAKAVAVPDVPVTTDV